MRGGGIEDLESVSHASMTAPPERATTTDRAESICVSYGLRSRQRPGRSPSGCAGISGALGIADRTSRPVRMRCSGHQSRSLLWAGGSGFHLNPAAPVVSAITSAQLARAPCGRSTLIRRTDHMIGWRC
jgi:hypothetical protein